MGPKKGSIQMQDRFSSQVRKRAGVVFSSLLLLFGFLALRLYAIQIEKHSDHLKRKDDQSNSYVDRTHPRGMILDRDDRVLALSISVPSVWADPGRVTPEMILDLSDALQLDADKLAQTLSPRRVGVSSPRRFAWVKREVSLVESNRVENLLEKYGVRRGAFGLRSEYVRRYPEGSLASHVLGFASDSSGGEGVERIMHDLLQGGVIRQDVRVDGKRRIVGGRASEVGLAKVSLTIVSEIQDIVEEELLLAFEAHQPKWATAVVMQPSTGAILALANLPSFDSNRPGESPPGDRRNRALTDPYPPGSTMKVIISAGALEEGKVSPSTVFDCESGLWRYRGRTLHDHHPYEKLTLTEVLLKSSNIGAAKLGALFLGKKGLDHWIRKFGFGAKTGIDLPAENGGVFRPMEEWTSYSLTSLPIGQEISVTPVQLVNAMSVIANGGWLMRPRVVRRVIREDGTILRDSPAVRVRRVISETTARKMRKILSLVVKEGTGRRAQVEGVPVGGKTGTTELIDRHGTKYAWVASFAGFAPVEDPRLCIAVILAEPAGEEHSGGKVAAPVVGNILRRALVFAH